MRSIRLRVLVCSLIGLEQYNVNIISKKEYMEAYP